MNQATIRKKLSFKGTGLHSGKNITINLEPAPENTGIVFIHNNHEIPAVLSSLTHTRRSIAIGKAGSSINTVEHILAALYMLGITNVYIHINEQEIPCMDGSAFPFLKKLNNAGFTVQKALVKPLILKHPVQLSGNTKFIMALPADALKITYGVNFDHPDLHNKTIHFDDITAETFEKQIAKARTFGFLKEVENLKKQGLALGGNLDNAVVLTDTGYVNKKLRFPDECIRHKVLDFLGALAFLNRPVRAHFIVYCSGHELDMLFMKKMKKIVDNAD